METSKKTVGIIVIFYFLVTATLVSCNKLEVSSTIQSSQTPEIQFSNNETNMSSFPVEFLSDWLDDYIISTRTSKGNWQNDLSEDVKDYGSGCPNYPVPHNQSNGIADNIERYFCLIRTKGNRRHILRFLVRPSFKEEIEHYRQFSPINSILMQENESITNAWLQDPDYQSFMTDIGGGFNSIWEWQHQVNTVLTQTPNYLEQMNKAAEYSGVKLSLVIRPFEAGLSTYKSIPVFNHEGTFIKNFLPSGSLELSQYPEQSGMIHYRQILSQALYGAKDLVKVDKVHFHQVENVTNAFLLNPGFYLKIYTSKLPPIDPSSKVFVKGLSGSYSFVNYSSIKSVVDLKRNEVQNFSVTHQNNVLTISGIDMPASHGYITVEGIDDLMNLPRVNESFDNSSLSEAPPRKITLEDNHGIKLGRLATYWAYHNYTNVQEQSTLYAGFKTGNVWSSGANTFTKKGVNDLRSISLVSRKLKGNSGVHIDQGVLSLSNKSIVVVVGEEYSNELFDFSKSLVVNHYKEKVDFFLKNFSEFDDVFVNSRTHSDLIQNLEEAYLPESLLNNSSFLSYIKSLPVSDMEEFTFRYAGERKYRHSCQQSSCLDKFRYFKQVQQAEDLTNLLYEVRKIAPNNRMRVIGDMLDGDYEETFDYLQNNSTESQITYLYPSNNYAPRITESITSLNFEKLQPEVVMLGLRGEPSLPAVNYVMTKRAEQISLRYFKESADVFYGSQDATHAGRNERVCDALTNYDGKFKKVILYEGINYLWYGNPSFNDYLQNCSN